MMSHATRSLPSAIGLLALAILSAGQTARAYDTAPIGWASVDAGGQNGTSGGAGGTTVTVTTPAGLADYATRTEPYVIQVSGTVALTTRIDIASDKTFIGIGTDPTITATIPEDDGCALTIKGTHNLIFRNLIVRQTPPLTSSYELDGIALTRDSKGNFAHHVWIDHCEFLDWVDGCIDITHASDYVTVSWNIFHTGALRGTLLGHSNSNAAEDTGHLRVTYHHNWFKTPQRNPRVRFSALCHVFNNYYDACSIYGVASVCEAHTLLENNYFKNVPYPFYSTSGYESSPAGYLVARDNVFVSCGTTREENGTAPEASASYAYTLDAAASVPTIVMDEAGLFPGPAGVSRGQTFLY